jgi:hypothetical protein
MINRADFQRNSDGRIKNLIDKYSLTEERGKKGEKVWILITLLFS